MAMYSANRNSHTHTSILMRDDGTHLCESPTDTRGGSITVG